MPDLRCRGLCGGVLLVLGVLAGAGASLDSALAQTKADEEESSATGDVAAILRDLSSAYKLVDRWPSRDFRGLDFLEPLVPRVAAERRDVGRIVLNSALPYSLLATAFAAESTDRSTLATIQRWEWTGLDEKQDNNPLQFALLGLAGASIFLPTPADGDSWALRLDRATVFALGVGISAVETEILKPVFDRRRPNGDCCASRPSGHATTAFASMAFLSNVVRDTLRPQDEPNLGLRILKETASALPYLGAGYMALERVHTGKHFLTDTFLGGAIGAFTTDMFYAWAFTRAEQGRGWLGPPSIRFDPSRRGFEVVISGRF